MWCGGALEGCGAGADWVNGGLLGGRLGAPLADGGACAGCVEGRRRITRLSVALAGGSAGAGPDCVEEELPGARAAVALEGGSGVAPKSGGGNVVEDVGVAGVAIVTGSAGTVRAESGLPDERVGGVGQDAGGAKGALGSGGAGEAVATGGRSRRCAWGWWC